MGADSNGTVLLKALRELGVDTSNVKVLASDVNTDDTYDMTSTASYCAVHGQDGNLIVACADFTILDSFTAEDVEALCNSSKGVWMELLSLMAILVLLCLRKLRT